MNSKNKNILLFICLFIILAIFLDLIFNFSNVLIENFQSQNSISSSYNAFSQTSTESKSNIEKTESLSNENKKNIKSVVSKMTGKVINIRFLSEDNTGTIINIPSPRTDKHNLTVNNDGTLSEDNIISSKPTQQFILTKITNINDYRTELSLNQNNGADISSTCTKYPFYIIKSNSINKRTPPWCLAYESGNIFVHPIGNYDNQKWEISNLVVSNKSFCTSDMDSTSVGNLRSIPDRDKDKLYDKDKIKINFNLNDELKHKLFGLENEQVNNESNQCPTYIPKKSINSLCRGCDADKL
jgi:hypothetical protein